MRHARVSRPYRFTIVIEADENGGYYACCPALPGCYSQGATLEETKTNMREAVQCHVESLAKDGAAPPREPEEFISAVEVTVPATHGR